MRRRVAPALARYAMVELALLSDADFRVSAFELGDGVSYTVDTLEHFRRQSPAARLFLRTSMARSKCCRSPVA